MTPGIDKSATKLTGKGEIISDVWITELSRPVKLGLKFFQKKRVVRD